MKKSGHPGARRRVFLGDGTSTEEELTAFRRPNLNAYRVDKFNSFARHLLKYGEGTWTYEPTPGGTMVTWTYSFVPSSLFASPLVGHIARNDFRQCMSIAMDRLKTEAERKSIP